MELTTLAKERVEERVNSLPLPLLTSDQVMTASRHVQVIW